MNQIYNNINNIYNNLNFEPRINKIFECNAPLCFTVGVELPPFQVNTFCSPRSLLIDGDYNLRFCNLFNEPLINMFNENWIVPFSLVKNQIELAYYKSRILCLEKICKDCVYENKLAKEERRKEREARKAAQLGGK